MKGRLKECFRRPFVFLLLFERVVPRNFIGLGGGVFVREVEQITAASGAKNG